MINRDLAAVHMARAEGAKGRATKKASALSTAFFKEVANSAAFLSAWEERQPCFMQNVRLNINISNITSSEVIEAACEQYGDCSYGRDVIVSNSNMLAESNRIHEWHSELHGVVTAERLRELSSKPKGTGNALRFLRQENLFDLLVKGANKFWKGEGGVSACVDVVTKDSLAGPPTLYSTDTILIQTEGVLHVQLLDVGDEWLALGQHCEFRSHRPCSVFPTLFTEEASITIDSEEDPKVVQDIILKPGDVLYIPQHLILYADTQHEECGDWEDNSTTISLTLPTQPMWSDAVDATVLQALGALGHDPDMRLFPRRTVDDKGLLLAKSVADRATVSSTVVREIFETALELVEPTMKDMETRCAYSHADFHVGDLLKSIDIADIIEKNDGLVKISNVLPLEVANKMLASLESISDAEWRLAQNGDADKNYATEIKHSFMSARAFPNSEWILDLFRDFLPMQPAFFSAGRYTTGHFIQPHDDRAYKEVGGQIYSRDIAIIYYLTKDWTAADGGGLLDMVTNKVHVPEFNSVVAFQVPRFHEVQPMVSERPRFSIFGWFMQPGKTYDLEIEESGQEDEEHEENEDEENDAMNMEDALEAMEAMRTAKRRRYSKSKGKRKSKNQWKVESA
eukprot:CFRG0986T1